MQKFSDMRSGGCHAYEVSNDELFNQEPYLGNAEEESESKSGSESGSESESKGESD